jgi:hypothetical protein
MHVNMSRHWSAKGGCGRRRPSSNLRKARINTELTTRYITLAVQFWWSSVIRDAGEEAAVSNTRRRLKSKCWPTNANLHHFSRCKRKVHRKRASNAFTHATKLVQQFVVPMVKICTVHTAHARSSHANILTEARSGDRLSLPTGTHLQCLHGGPHLALLLCRLAQLLAQRGALSPLIIRYLPPRVQLLLHRSKLQAYGCKRC